MKNVIIASPVKQNPQILQEFLGSLEGLNKQGLTVEYLFVDDDDQENQLLREFAASREGVRILPGRGQSDYFRDETTHYWQEPLVWRVAEYKDQMIRIAQEQGCDYLFLVDSDLVLHPQTLVHLVSLEKDIVAEVFWTCWDPELPALPQVWLGDQYRIYEKKRDEQLDEEEITRRTLSFFSQLQQPGTYPVGGLGACTLISAQALAKGVAFREIPNLDLTGEDRHFCIRAAALGLELWADTHFPPFHIYRESELAGLAAYKQSIQSAGSRITLAMLVRNEAERYLEQVLSHAARYIDGAVILDDASTDGTPELCRKILGHLPLTLVINEQPAFHNEIQLRKQLWELACGTNPDWLLILDADEIFEERAVQELPRLAQNPGVDGYYFRLYDMWDEEHYREDEFWKAHQTYRAFMVRTRAGFSPLWRDTPQHCGRFPLNITELRGSSSELRLKHLGWIKPADRLAKFDRYKQLDPKARYGLAQQYDSILAPKPKLIPWEE